jgi:hypothetical protein
VYGTEESIIADVSFDDVSLELNGGPLQDVAGGNVDLRPVLDPKLQIFARDIPGLEARYVSHLCVRDFDLHWGKDIPSFFTHGIAIEHFNGVTIEHFSGTGSPGNENAFPVLLRDGEGIRGDLTTGEVHEERVKK